MQLLLFQHRLILPALFAAALFCSVPEVRAEERADWTTLRRLPPTGSPLELESSVETNASWHGLTEQETHDIGPSLTEFAWGREGLKVVPYAAFWADMIYSTARTSPGAFTVFVFSREDQGEAAFTIDARRTRLGLEVIGPAVRRFAHAETGGRVEIDFHGNFVTENRATVLLRHAYWEVKDERYRLLVGQTWDVISPLYPSTVNYSHGYFSGDIGFRRTQFRAERYVSVSDFLRLTLQASLNQDIVTDFPSETGIRREAADWPVVQARIAVALGKPTERRDPITLGFSGHVGETGFDFLTAGPPPLDLPPVDDARFKSWSFNIDVRVPISDRLRIQGEFFTGANLSAFLGGIGQGVCPCLRVPIRSTGGWGEMSYDWTPWLQSNVGFGLDDPNNRDSLFGRTYNQFVFANLVYNVTEQLTTAIEVTHWKTLYRETRSGLIPPDQLTPSQPGESVTIDFMVKFEF